MLPYTVYIYIYTYIYTYIYIEYMDPMGWDVWDPKQVAIEMLPATLSSLAGEKRTKVHGAETSPYRKLEKETSDSWKHLDTIW